MFDLLCLERGKRCEICGKKGIVGKFHILTVGSHPRLRYSTDNILLSCWFPCHHNYHHDFHKAKKIEVKIKQLRGDDYEDRLKALDLMQPKLDMFHLGILEAGLKEQVRRLR